MPIIILIGISLSMDAFSLALAYGTLNLKNKDINLLSIIVGLYHYFMPLLGMFVGKKIINLLPISSNFLVFIVLFLIGIQMIIESFKEEKEIKKLNLFEMILFGLAVSIDSFSLGLGLKTLYKNPYISALVFSISSMLFTYIGLKLGKKINQKIGNISTIFGGITLIIIGIIYLV